MTIASELLEQHIVTLVHDNAQWQTLIDDNIVWELADAPSLGHPARLSGRGEAVRHATWFAGAVDGTYLSTLCSLVTGCRRQDFVYARILRSSSGSLGAGSADSRVE